MNTTIDTLLIGKISTYGPNKEPSAYIKQPTNETIQINKLGLIGNEVADLKVHGGRDKAIMHYAFDHYAKWKKEQPQHSSMLESPGAFGENLSSLSFTEENICIGDQFRLGTAIVEVSQGRQPCWKLGHRFNDQNMVQEVIKKARGGWYYRVIEEGEVTQGARIELIERDYPEWTVKRVFTLLIGTKYSNDLFGVLYRNRMNQKSLRELKKVDPLAESWKGRLNHLLNE
ncbi:MAG: MOSC domain-containing protein [Pseudomonadota bacterium]